MNSDPAFIEAKAETRQAARDLRELYSALVAEGFNEKQALTIVGQILAAARPE